MEQQKAMECGSGKASPDVLKPHTYIYVAANSFLNNFVMLGTL
jgi:hypothetical protein